MSNLKIYGNLLVYYFSGTGNAKMSAKWIAEVAENNNINVKVICIDRFKSIEIPQLKGRTLIGFCYPTHGFNAPPVMLKFISKFPAIKNADVFLLNTRAGMKLYKLFMPGLSGVAQLLPVVILWFKKYKIKSMYSVDLPSNWISIHPGLRKKVVDSMFVQYHKKVSNFAKKILSGKGTYNDLYDLPVDIALVPISLGYYFIGRFALSKTFFASNACDACEVCKDKCPTSSIIMKDNRPFWAYTCESCMRCMNICPKRAINTPHTFTVLLWYFWFAILFPFVEYILSNQQILSIKLNSTLVYLLKWVIGSGAGILVIFISYYILHYLLRYKYFNNFITYTSLTKYKFWRRYKVPKDF